MKWDKEVDIVCAGSGAAGLATAITVVDLGGQVFLANTLNGGDNRRSLTRCRTDRRYPWPDIDVVDGRTNDYLAELVADLGPLAISGRDIGVPIRVAHEPAPVESGRTVAPFVGARLREWAAHCLASPYGYLYTRVSDWQSTSLESADGEMIEVVEIGAMSPDPADVGGSVLDWLNGQARDRDIAVQTDSSLQGLVFEAGDVVGAVFETPGGTVAIRARHGVTIAVGGPQLHMASRYPLPSGDVRVCMVGQHASRFGRVELITSESVTRGVASTCHPGNRQLHAKLRDSHSRSHSWCCGKLHGYPPFGQ